MAVSNDGGFDHRSVDFSPGIVASSEISAENGIALEADLMQAVEFTEWVWMIVGADVEVGVGVVGVDADRGALATALVAARILAGL